MLADVRFGSLANVAILNSNVCFIPDSGHPADAVGMSAKCQYRTSTFQSNDTNTLIAR
jgi:hypothetical protein